eukprot:5180897-Alexandrium_andersonii.AAC.1
MSLGAGPRPRVRATRQRRQGTSAALGALQRRGTARAPPGGAPELPRRPRSRPHRGPRRACAADPGARRAARGARSAKGRAS